MISIPSLKARSLPDAQISRPIKFTTDRQSLNFGGLIVHIGWIETLLDEV